MLMRHAPFGRMIDDQIEDGAKITLITSVPESSGSVQWFADLEARGVSLFFHRNLHAKVYAFSVDQQRIPYGQSHADLLILGSANLTEAGLPFHRDAGNEELCYELPQQEMENLVGYITHLAVKSIDLARLRVELNRRKGK
jgi:hypothetical protein